MSFLVYSAACSRSIAADATVSTETFASTPGSLRPGSPGRTGRAEPRIWRSAGRSRRARSVGATSKAVARAFGGAGRTPSPQARRTPSSRCDAAAVASSLEARPHGRSAPQRNPWSDVMKRTAPSSRARRHPLDGLIERLRVADTARRRARGAGIDAIREEEPVDLLRRMRRPEADDTDLAAAGRRDVPHRGNLARGLRDRNEQPALRIELLEIEDAVDVRPDARFLRGPDDRREDGNEALELHPVT